MKTKNKQPRKMRNWLSYHACTRRTFHSDARKEASRKACRGKVTW